jgi:hypothetical protein
MPHNNRHIKSESESEEQESNTFVECKGDQENSMDFENEAAPEEDSEEDIPLSKRKKG